MAVCWCVMPVITAPEIIFLRDYVQNTSELIIMGEIIVAL